MEPASVVSALNQDVLGKDNLDEIIEGFYCMKAVLNECGLTGEVTTKKMAEEINDGIAGPTPHNSETKFKTLLNVIDSKMKSRLGRSLLMCND